MKIYELLNFKTRLGVHLISLINVIFLTFYTRLVCPFLNYVEFNELFTNLLILFVFQVFLREAMYLFIPVSSKKTPPRQLYLLSVINWLIMGLVAAVYHELYYEPYPFDSQLKVISGYWILGAGICSQIEYFLFEKSYKKRIKNVTEATGFLDHIPRRITESAFIFTLAPSLAMLIMVIRYALQDQLLDTGVVLEVIYINIFFLLFCLITSFFYGNELKRDAAKITLAISKIKEGLFNIELDQNRPDELGIVSKGINEMASGLQLREKIKEAFGRFVSPKIAEEFIEKYARGEKNLRSQGEKKELSILMSDIRSFTNMSETTPPEEITYILNTYFNDMVRVIEENGGIVDKFIGDAIMAIFGLLDKSASNPSLSAVQAGLDMEKALEKYNLTNKRKLETGIGIHTGEVIAGYIGSDNRLEYTVIGSPVNLASRIEGETKDPDIPNLVFTKKVANDIASKIPSVKIKECYPKGIENAVPLFSTIEDVENLKHKNSNKKS